ncbi:MAG: single-stranded DNA-binding protein, partial [Anaerotignaceae bacterium]
MPKDTESNSVLLSGEVASECTFSHEIYGEGFYTFKVKSKRLSGVEDLLPITVSERITCINDLLIGKKINIKGQIRSYNSFQIKKSRLLLTIFAREITEVEAEDTNQIFLNGFICKPPIYRTTPFGREITDVL